MPKRRISADALPHQMFIRIAEIGWMNQDGKIRLSSYFSGKSVANVDRPLAIALQVAKMIVGEACWTTEEAMEHDIAEFHKGIAVLIPEAKNLEGGDDAANPPA